MNAYHDVGTNVTQFGSIYTVMLNRENVYIRDPKLQSLGQLLKKTSNLLRSLYFS